MKMPRAAQRENAPTKEPWEKITSSASDRLKIEDCETSRQEVEKNLKINGKLIEIEIVNHWHAGDH